MNSNNPSLAYTQNGAARVHLVPVLIIIVVTILVFAPMTLFIQHISGDYDWHIARALQLKTDGSLDGLPHFLYHLIVIGSSELFPGLSPRIQGGLPVLFASVLLALLTYYIFIRQFASAGYPSKSMAATILTLIVTTAGPILVTGADITYLYPTIYHNPTQILLRLWVVPITLLAVTVFHPLGGASGRKKILILALASALMVLMTLTKPNYTIGMLPALVLMASYRIIRRLPLNWPLLLALVIPASILLGVQFFSAYVTPDDHGLELRVFGWMMIWTPAWQIVVQCIASIAFPLTVYLVFLPSTRKNLLLNFSWLIFLANAFFAYFVNEKGRRFPDGNFVWGAYVSVFVLILVTTLFLIREYPNYFAIPAVREMRRMHWRQWLPLTMLALHGIFGLGYWIITFVISSGTVELY